MRRVTPGPSGKMEHAVQAGDEFRNGFPGGFLVPATNLPGAQGNRPFSWRGRPTGECRNSLHFIDSYQILQIECIEILSIYALA